jgi:hypothetical protein
MPDKVYDNQGRVAVLYSPEHGAGWSSWAHTEEIRQRCLFDPEVVQWVLENKPAGRFADGYFEKKYGGYFYDGGMRDLQIEWLQPGEKFIVREYDGYESIETISNMDWKEA